MPKRSADDEGPAMVKKPRGTSSGGPSRRVSEAEPQEVPSPEAQRLRTSSTVSPAMLSGPPKTLPDPTSIRRRMNPDSLAFRLGPDLIKELEKLLTPGMTEMPPFSVRQEIQQRYKVDRRHIYDWFHNKGLRVSSSEKRNEQRAAKLKDTRSMPDTRIQRRIRTHTESASVVTPDKGSSSKHIPSGTSTPILSGSTRPTPSPLTGSILVPYEAACHAPRQQAGYPSHPFCGHFDPRFFPQPPVLDFSPTHATAHTPYPFSSMPDGHNLSGVDPVTKPTDRTFDWISEQQKIPYTPNALASPSLDCTDTAKTTLETMDAIWLLDHEQALPQPQREAFYQSLCDVLPPACGIEESVGSYKAYMDQQSRGYYDRLAFGGLPYVPYEYPPYPFVSTPKAAPSFSALTSVSTAYSSSCPRAFHSGSLPPPPPAPVQRTPILGTSEFSNWVRFYGRSQALNVAPSPSQTPSLSETNTSASSLLWPPESFEKRPRSGSDSMCLEMSEILESPVLRSRQTTADVGHQAMSPNEEYWKKLLKDYPQGKRLFSTDVSTASNNENCAMVNVASIVKSQK
ncbi:hypothetical protein BDY19DRAFT_913314 [Irpex rosettiformis]|uniref:Uncharacterized protein n=1 Tax=Irpex rosettiformis TaxID=378272 RepID=A0ACB8UJH6_9APHY|nr:hypothetical protein BDY19DRAFT_913314 [Irpex rosettiformis]